MLRGIGYLGHIQIWFQKIIVPDPITLLGYIFEHVKILYEKNLP